LFRVRNCGYTSCFKDKWNVGKYGRNPVRSMAYTREDISESICEISASMKEMLSAGVRDEMNSLMGLRTGFVFSALQNMELIQRANAPLLTRQAKMLLIMP
jgi:hypothetical protein